MCWRGPQLMSDLTKGAVLKALEGRFIEVFSAYLDVKQSGQELITHCPFTAELLEIVEATEKTTCGFLMPGRDHEKAVSGGYVCAVRSTR